MASRVSLLLVTCIIVVSFNIQTVAAITMTPPYTDGEAFSYYGGAEYNLNYGVAYAIAGYSQSGKQWAKAWVGERFTASTSDTYTLSTSTRLTAYLEAIDNGPTSYAYVNIKLRCWRVFAFWLIEVKTEIPWRKVVVDSESIQFSNYVIADEMNVDLVQGTTYVFGVELYVYCWNDAWVRYSETSYNYASLKVDWLDYYIAP